jgi:DNA-binding FadR family transcriptional regulator
MRLGRNGGLVVAAPTASAVQESLAIYLEYAGVSVDDVFEVRTVLEGFSVVAASGGLEDDRLHSLRQFIRDVETSESTPTPGSTRRFHETVAEATGNVALSLFVQALDFLSGRLCERAATAESGTGTFDQRILQDHSQLATAIVAGDGLMARSLTTQHMDVLKGALADSQSDSLLNVEFDFSELVNADPTPGSVLRRSSAAVADRIRREILNLRWPVGRSLGFEADLMERYGVGRAQFREAVRVLESHSVVEMRRGKGGGMVITAPDGQAMMRAGSLYLRHRNVTATNIRDLREELEIASVSLAIQKLSVDGIEKLTSILERERNWPDNEFAVVSHDLHGVIADLSGNLPLALLLSILMQSTAERLYSGDPRRVTEPPDAIRLAHRAIVEAIVARDVPLATRRMRKHLRAVASWTGTANEPMPDRVVVSQS